MNHSKSFQKLYLRSIICIISFILMISCNNGKFDGTSLDTDNSNYMDQLVTKEVEEKQEAINPTGVQATDSQSNEQYPDKIKISWNIPQGVSFVRVAWFNTKAAALQHTESSILFQYEKSSEVECSPKISYIAGSYEDSQLNVGTIKYYIVKFYDPSGVLLGYSAPICGTTAHLPYNADASKDSTERKITVNWEWNESWVCDNFKIYKCSTRNGDYLPITDQIDSTLRTFIDTEISEEAEGSTFYYKVKAVSNATESLFSNYAVGKTVREGAPDKPVDLTCSLGSYRNSIVLNWAPPEETGIDVDKYWVYFKSGTTWSTTGLDAESELTYSFTTEENKPITFYVCGSNSIGEGIPSALNTGFIIPKPESLTASFLESAEKTELNWAAVSLPGTTVNYRVYRSTDNNLDGSDTLLTTIDIVDSAYSDADAEEGTEFYYFVSVVNPLTSEEGFESNGARGVRGYLPVPQLSATQGNSSQLNLLFENYKDYLTVEIQLSRPTYKPRYYGKPMFSTVDGTVPSNYEKSLQYKSDPLYQYTNWVIKVSDHKSANWIDSQSVTGENHYKARYRYKGLLTSNISSEISGFRQITNREFLAEVLQTVSKSQYKLYKIHQGGTSAAGSDGPYNGDKTGQIYYNAQISSTDYGLGANVPITYTNYLDYYLTLNDIPGNPQKSVSGMSLKGHLHGGNITNGIYEGEVIFNIAVLDGMKCGGHDQHSSSDYKVRQKINGVWTSAETIEWDFDRTAIESYLSQYPY